MARYLALWKDLGLFQLQLFVINFFERGFVLL